MGGQGLCLEAKACGCHRLEGGCGGEGKLTPGREGNRPRGPRESRRCYLAACWRAPGSKSPKGSSGLWSLWPRVYLICMLGSISWSM